jgi:hypothetical protein
MPRIKKETPVTDPRVKEIRGFYVAVFKKMYGFDPTINFMLTGVMIKRLLKDFNEWQIQMFIIIHFNWRGMDGTDDFVFKRLRDKAFPFEWIPNNVNGYQAYIRNVLGLDFGNDKVLQEYLHAYIKSL